VLVVMVIVGVMMVLFMGVSVIMMMFMAVITLVGDMRRGSLREAGGHERCRCLRLIPLSVQI
jgi:hypothetical protein